MHNLIKNVMNHLHLSVTVVAEYLINYYIVFMIFVMFCVTECCVVLIVFCKNMHFIYIYTDFMFVLCSSIVVRIFL